MQENIERATIGSDNDSGPWEVWLSSDRWLHRSVCTSDPAGMRNDPKGRRTGQQSRLRLTINEILRHSENHQEASFFNVAGGAISIWSIPPSVGADLLKN